MPLPVLLKWIVKTNNTIIMLIILNTTNRKDFMTINQCLMTFQASLDYSAWTMDTDWQFSVQCTMVHYCMTEASDSSWTRRLMNTMETRKPSYRWQTRATRKHAKNCSNSTCLQRCRWQYWPIFMRLAAVASKICKIPRNSLKIQTYEVQGHPRSSILVPIKSPCMTSY